MPSRSVTVIGHGYASIGVAEATRACIRGLQALSYDVRFFDVYKHLKRSDPDHRALLEPIETKSIEGDVRIYHVNGDEVDPVLNHLRASGQDVDQGCNIIVPAWELPIYPAEWAEKLKWFDEIWAGSRFTQEALARAGLTSHHVGQATEFAFQPFLSRRHFGIRESAFVLLNFSDESSHPARKNPLAVVDAYKRLRRDRPYDDIQLVLKTKSLESAGSTFLDLVREEVPDAHLIGQRLSDYEMRSLMWCSNCFVSLHRSEGFGRGSGEAMYMGRAAMATAWSGNMDYMTPESSLLVPYELVPVLADEYPFHEGQHWAEPDGDAVVSLLKHAIDDPAALRERALRGRARAAEVCTNRSMGVRMSDSLEQLGARNLELASV